MTSSPFTSGSGRDGRMAGGFSASIVESTAEGERTCCVRALPRLGFPFVERVGMLAEIVIVKFGLLVEFGKLDVLTDSGEIATRRPERWPHAYRFPQGVKSILAEAWRVGGTVVLVNAAGEKHIEACERSRGGERLCRIIVEREVSTVPAVLFQIKFQQSAEVA